jgi:hypothetical protein
MTSRIRKSDRVRHIDGREGVVDEVETAMGHTWVTVHLDEGGSLRCAEGYWEKLPGWGATGRAA